MEKKNEFYPIDYDYEDAINLCSIENFIYVIKQGYHFGYPFCCVLEFASMGPGPMVKFRGLADENYVPCKNCYIGEQL